MVYETTENIRKLVSKKDAGVYYLEFSSGKGYIGSSIELYTRLCGHLNSMRKGNHKSSLLQEEYNKCGFPNIKILLKEHVMNIMEITVREKENEYSKTVDTSLNNKEFHIIRR